MYQKMFIKTMESLDYDTTTQNLTFNNTEDYEDFVVLVAKEVEVPFELYLSAV